MTLVSKLDTLFGSDFVSFIRDPESGNFIVSVFKSKLTSLGLSPEGWKFVMGSNFCVRTMPEADWGEWADEALKQVNP